jgi:hypothetical protein
MFSRSLVRQLMPYDLAIARASVNWAEANLPSFKERTDRWLSGNFSMRVEQTNDDLGHDLLVMVEKSPLPLSFAAEAGAYIHAIRGSLDIVAAVVAEANEIAGEDDGAAFPRAHSKAAFDSGKGFKGAGFVRALPPAERVLLESLKPYEGGDDALFVLLDMDRIRRHKRLLNVEPKPIAIWASGGERDIEWLRPPQVGVDGETIFARAPKGGDHGKVQITPCITLDEAAAGGRWPLFPLLEKFILVARDVIWRFESIES